MIWPELSRRDEKQNRLNNERKLNSLTWNTREAQKGLKRKLNEQFSRARAEVQATVDAVKGDRN